MATPANPVTAGANGPDPRRRRRRRRRATIVVIFMSITLVLSWFFESQATTTVILVRHADPLVGAGDNPPLSPAGQKRARELARVLADVDVVAGVDAIFVTPYRPTRETAEPLAERLNLPLLERPVDDVERLRKRILRKYKGRIVLVVTSPQLLPLLIRSLQGSKKVPPIGDGEFDNLYIVSVPWYGKVKTLRLRYGEPPGAVVPESPAAGVPAG